MNLRNRVLFICSHTPGENAPEAGHKTAWRNIERLAVLADVDVLLITNAAELQNLPTVWPPNAKLLGVVAVTKIGKLIAILTHARRWSPRFAARLTSHAITTVRRVLSQTGYDRVWLEFTECACFIDLIPAEIPVTISAPDVLVQWALRSSSFYRYLAPSTFDDELAVLKRASQIVAQSPKDAELIRSLYLVENVSVEQPALASFLRHIKRDASSVVPRSILFWGAMSRPENSRAVIRFLDIHWPRISTRFPDAALYIVGSAPPPHVVSRASSKIIITGFLDDPSKYFERAAVGVAPLEEGAGIKVKVLEMLEAGLPVVSTPVGAEGIAEDSRLHVVDFEQLGEAVIKLLNTI